MLRHLCPIEALRRMPSAPVRKSVTWVPLRIEFLHTYNTYAYILSAKSFHPLLLK